MTRTVDTIITTNDNLADTVNALPAGCTIELGAGNHILTAPLKPRDNVMIFSRVRGMANIMCSEYDGHHSINGGNNVTFANVGFTGYKSNKAQTAWINSSGAMNGLQLLSCDLFNIAHRAVTIAPNTRVYDCAFSNIGVLGIGYTNIENYDVSIDHCEFSNITGANAGGLVEYGAMKLGNIRDSEVNDCYAHDCKEAYWVDGEPHFENYGLRITNNLAENIEKSAIHYEISHGAYIAHNRIRTSGQPNEDWAWGAGILIIDSAGSTVVDNVVDCRHGANGISIGKQDRKPYAYHNRVDSNHIIYGDKSHSGIYDADNSRVGFFYGNQYFAGGNVFTRNTHYVPTKNTRRYGIDHKHNTFLQWQYRGQDVDGAEVTHDAIPDSLNFPDDWKLNNDFVPPLPTPPIIVDPPPSQKPPAIPIGTTFKFNGTIEVIEG